MATDTEPDETETEEAERLARVAARQAELDARVDESMAQRADDYAHRPVRELLAEVMATLGPIGKNQTMSAGKGGETYQYRGIEQILDRLTPMLAAKQVVPWPRVVDRQLELVERGQFKNIWRLVTLTVEYRFVGPAGDVFPPENLPPIVTCGEGLDNGDKAANKAMTAALKQALTQVFMVAAGQADPDHEAHADEDQSSPVWGTTVAVKNWVLDEVRKSNNWKGLAEDVLVAVAKEVAEKVEVAGEPKEREWTELEVGRLREPVKEAIAALAAEEADGSPFDDDPPAS